MRASGSLRLIRDRIPLGSRPKGDRQEPTDRDRDVLVSGRGADNTADSGACVPTCWNRASARRQGERPLRD